MRTGRRKSGAPFYLLMEPEATLSLYLPTAATMRLLTPVFNAGVGIRTFSGISIMELLCGQLGIDEDIVQNLIQTIFINGRAVDKTEDVKIPAGAVIALSAAMPGLVGATLRKGGVLAAFREGISYRDKNRPDDAQPKETIIHLKLFNMVTDAVAPRLLKNGVWVKSKMLQKMLMRTESGAITDAASIEWNGAPISKLQLGVIQWPDGWVALKAAIQSGA